MRRRKLRKPPRAASAINIERSYYATIRAMMREARELVDRLVIPALPSIVAEAGLSPDRLDNWPESVDAIFDSMRVSYYQAVPQDRVRRAAQDAASATAKHGRKQLAKQIKAVIGVDPFLTEPWLNDMAAAFVKDNVGLITSIPERYFDEIEQSVNRGVRAGRRHEPIAREIKERYHVSEARARLIARDQVSKFNGDLAKVRQVRLGIDVYIWRTSMDERVRDSHERMEGMYCLWSDPSVWSHDGKKWVQRPESVPHLHPGEDYQDRCTAEPVLEDLLEQAHIAPMADEHTRSTPRLAVKPKVAPKPGLKPEPKQKPKALSPKSQPKPDDSKRLATKDEWVKTLSGKQKRAFEDWTAEDYRDISAFDAGMLNAKTMEKRGSALKKKTDEIYSALQTAPRYKGTAYRGLAHLDPETAEQFKEGAIFRNRSLSSWTTRRDIAVEYSENQTYADERYVIFKVKNKSGPMHDINHQDLTVFGGEGEVIMEGRAEYRIKSVQTKTSKGLTGYLVELEDL